MEANVKCQESARGRSTCQIFLEKKKRHVEGHDMARRVDR